MAVLTATWVMPAAADARDGCTGTAGRAGNVTIEVGGTPRLFIVRAPRTAQPGLRQPVVFAFHAYSVGARMMAARVNVSSAWPEAVVVYPDGLPRDDGQMPQPAWQRSPGDLQDRDVRFFDAMRSWLETNHCIDTKRVFVLGYSNGAMFANLLACLRPGVIAGAASAAGSISCTPTRPVPVILSHGTSDVTVSYARGAAAAVAWSKQNGCQNPPAIGAPGCHAAEGCPGAGVTLCTHPGGHEYDDKFTAEATAFFAALSKPPPAGAGNREFR